MPRFANEERKRQAIAKTETSVRRIARFERQQDRLDERIAELRRERTRISQTEQREVSRLAKLVDRYEKVLTNHGQRSIWRTSRGRIGYRISRPRVNVSDEQAVIRRLKLTPAGRQFIRTVELIDREGLLRQRGKRIRVRGLEIAQYLQFFVEVKLSPRKKPVTFSRDINRY